MALDRDALATALEAIANAPPAAIEDTHDPDSEDPDDMIAGCASAWATAVGDYMTALVPPCSTLAVAQAALQAALVVAFKSSAAAPGMEAAFLSLGPALGSGMAASLFTGAHPGTPVGFAVQFAKTPMPATTHAAAAEIADLIDVWAKLGTAVSAVGVTTHWS